MPGTLISDALLGVLGLLPEVIPRQPWETEDWKASDFIDDWTDPPVGILPAWPNPAVPGFPTLTNLLVVAHPHLALVLGHSALKQLKRRVYITPWGLDVEEEPFVSLASSPAGSSSSGAEPVLNCGVGDEQLEWGTPPPPTPTTPRSPSPEPTTPPVTPLFQTPESTPPPVPSRSQSSSPGRSGPSLSPRRPHSRRPGGRPRGERRRPDRRERRIFFAGRWIPRPWRCRLVWCEDHLFHCDRCHFHHSRLMACSEAHHLAR